MIAKPAILLFLAIGIHYFVSGFLPAPAGAMPLFFKTSGQILLLSFCYGVMLLYAHILRKWKKLESIFQLFLFFPELLLGFFLEFLLRLFLRMLLLQLLLTLLLDTAEIGAHFIGHTGQTI